MSMLDIMTCALGAVLLLFLLKQGSMTMSIDDISMQAEVIDRLRKEIVSQERSNAESWIKSATKVSADGAGTGLFGLPPLSGDVVFVLDASGSVVKVEAKLKRMIELVRSFLLGNQDIEAVRIMLFDNKPEWSTGWTPVVAPDAREAVIDKIKPALMQRGGRTNLREALNKGIVEASGRVGGAHVVLISDGISTDESTVDSRIFVDALHEDILAEIPNGTGGVRVHTVALLSYEGPFEADQGLGDRFERKTRNLQYLGLVLQRVSAVWGGRYLAVPVEQGK
ncbi:MAG: vWA domain-containing protein [Candidatus Thiodiazotropha sp.]